MYLCTGNVLHKVLWVRTFSLFRSRYKGILVGQLLRCPPLCTFLSTIPPFFRQDCSHRRPQEHPHPRQCRQSRQHSSRGPMTNMAVRAQAAVAVETKFNPHPWWRPPGGQPAPRQGAPCWAADTAREDHGNSHTACRTSSSSLSAGPATNTLKGTAGDPQATCSPAEQ